MIFQKLYNYDIEVFPNMFCATFKDFETGKHFLFSIFEDRNDLDSLKRFLNRQITLIGYNNIMYDGTVIQYLLQMKNLKNVNKELFEFSSDLIGSDRGYASYRFRKYQYPEEPTPYSQIDLMKIIEISGIAPSLKQVAISLKWHRIQDLPLEYDAIVSKEEEEVVYDYNLNDVGITEKLYTTILPRIELREKLSVIYGVDLINSSNSKMADKILERSYANQLKADMKIIRNLRTKRKQFYLRECIAEPIEFETRMLKRVKEEIGNTLVRESSKYKYSKTISFGGVDYELGVGGLHSVDKPARFTEDESWKIYDQDVASYYPSMMINNKIMPEHLGEDFTKILKTLTDERLSAKKTDKVKAEGLKVTINSIFGKLGSDTFWLYDPKAMCSVTVSGQLYLLMLIEKLVTNGIQVISANTDGVVSRVHVSQEEKFNEISLWWQELTGFVLERTEYAVYFRQDVNNYITKKYNGEIKAKGRYVKETAVEKGYKFPVVPLAMYNFALNGIPVEDTIRKHDNILDFCISQKVGKDFQTEYRLKDSVENLQKNNRFFIALDGGELKKRRKSIPAGEIEYSSQYEIEDDGEIYQPKKEKGVIGLYVGEKVRILNDYDSSIPISDYDVSYEFYIEEAKKYTDNVTDFVEEFQQFVDEESDYVPPANIKQKEDFFFKYYMLKSISDNFVDGMLWLKENFTGENFCDFMMFATDNKKASSKIVTMIKLNYFADFGNQKKLLKFYEEFTKGENKYTSSLSEKSKQKRILNLREFWNSMKNETFSIYEQISNESSIIGFPFSKYEVNKYYVFVKNVDIKKSYHPTLKLQILKTGEEKEVKVNKKVLEEHPLVSGDVVLCKSFQKKFRKTKNEEGNWIDSAISDLYLETWYKLKPEDEFST